MAIVVEDGSGKSDANSYASAADADAYFADRGDTVWSALNASQKDAALIVATDYMQQTYRHRWRGTRVDNAQALDWPRDGVYKLGNDLYPVDADVVPLEVLHACYMLALKSRSVTLLPDVTGGVQGPVKKQKVGSLEVEYAEGITASVPQYHDVDRVLLPLLAVSGGVVEVLRA